MLYLGLFPNTLVEVTTQAVAVLGR
jgi:hypothetical protein